MKLLEVPFGILRSPEDFFREIQESHRIGEKILGCLGASVVMFGLFGGIVGAFSGWEQSASSAIKLPVLFGATVLICLPTLYVASLLLGAKEHIGQVLALLSGTLAVTSVLLVSFAPVSAFFLMTSSNYQFFKLLNVFILLVSGSMGVRFFRRAVRTLWGEAAASREKVLTSWILLYAFVGTQLGWTMRPFFGAPNAPFQVVRESQDNFYVDIARSVREVLSLGD